MFKLVIQLGKNAKLKLQRRDISTETSVFFRRKMENEWREMERERKGMERDGN